MTGPEFDAVIAGGGLSGMSLLAHLAAGGWRDRSVLLIDDPAAPATAAWASWTSGPGLLDAAASPGFRQVRVYAAGTSRVLPLGRYRYQTVRRPDLRQVVMDLMAGCPGFAVRSGRVDRVRDGPDAAEVVVDGQPVRARWVFDSVSAAPPGPVADAHLAFTGWEVRCAGPVFDPDTPTLFDFRTPRVVGARFGYVLPEDPHRALVELTEFVPRRARPSPPAERRAALAAYLGDVLGAGDYDVLRTESAVLPLQVTPRPRRRGRVLAIGARGGLVKASTGYAYQRVQRDSEAIAASLARHGHPFDLPRPRRRHRLLDAVLLAVLDRDPAELERAFARLFFANPAERVLRFLDEDTGVRDELRLIRSLPAAPYLRAVAGLAVRRDARRVPSLLEATHASGAPAGYGSQPGQP
ncbi:MAG TPA: lycopene cyclase family protein [Pilimelia sp.]|nr:lycopene cyclase family protein [Pilimelia sp.]